MTKPQQRYYWIFVITLVVLAFPFIAMQFSDEVQWTIMDFVIMGIMVFSSGVLINFVFTKIKKKKHQILLISAIVLLFLLLWMELAVGLFGTPISGN